MDVFSLTNQVYTSWGKQYKSFDWNNWSTFINMDNKHKAIRHIIYWFDTNVLQQISKSTAVTLNVRIRIVCGMINKIPPSILSRDLKYIFMECIWDTYKQFQKDYIEWHCKYILCLPF